jgi:hypothetical protein
VSIDDQHDLYERLDLAVGAVTPREAPVGGAMKRGRGIRLRRRSAVVAGVVAVVAAGVVAVPSLRHTATERPAGARYTATVQPPGPHSPPGLIASGMVNGQRWQVTVGKPGAGGAGPGQQFTRASGPAFGPDGLSSGPALAPDSTEPVSFNAMSSGPSQAQFGAVRADVSYITVRLGNGILLTLHPVRVWGVREVAFAVPVGATITEATAYSRHGVIATAIPFNYPGGIATFSAWLRPGQHALSRATGLIGTGRVSGRAWSVTAYLGPWGICLEGGAPGTNAGGCVPTTSPLGTSLMFRSAGTPGVAGGTASASVARVVAYPSGGAPVQARPVTVGPQKFFSFPLPDGTKAVRWKAYDSSGNVVASGTS